MSQLPPGFLDELRSRVSLAQVVGRKVVWDNRKSNQAKGDLWAPCPFHQEKTASFHVEDRKGFYYCFGCHAKGDAISFVKETENVGFMEAVEILAREAGMSMPQRDPAAQKKADRRKELSDVTEAALSYFRLQLKTQAASEARAYIAKRGISPAIMDRFELGFAPSARASAYRALLEKGIPAELILEAGIATRPDDGGEPYDAFRNRIIFPIRDARGRCIGFGGRAMDPNARAKYLNSRETPLFDKGRSLFNHGPAREAVGKGARLIVAEGYMDVIALVQAGFDGAVAPLGTAITEDQLHLLWRVSSEPIVTLDGDKAGQRAAMRLIDLALPMLEGGNGLRFAALPEGLDPDDLLKSQGFDAMEELLNRAEPMVNLLWRRETEGASFDSPERRSALDMRLRKALGQIKDPGLRRHYGDAIATMRRELFQPRSKVRGLPGWRRSYRAAKEHPLSETRAKAGALDGAALRSALIIASLFKFPQLIDQFESQLDRFEPDDRDHRDLANFLLRSQSRDETALRRELEAEFLAPALERLSHLSHLAITPFLVGEGDRARAEESLSEAFAKLAADRAVQEELREASQDLETQFEAEDPALSFRLSAALRSKFAAQSGQTNDDAEQFGETSEKRAEFHRLLSTAGQGKKNKSKSSPNQ